MIRKHAFLTDTIYSSKLKSLKPLGPLFDIGAGIRPCPLWPVEHICVEPHLEYVQFLKHAGYKVYHGTALEVIPDLPREGTIIAIDVIEHMEREDGEKLRDLMEEWPQALIFTPNGFMEQSGVVNGLDPWGLHGMKWQKHRSGWTENDFPEWRVLKAGKGILCFRS